MKFKLILTLLILSMMSEIAHAGFPSFLDIAKGVGTGGIDSGGSHGVEQNVEAFLKVASDVDGLVVTSSDVLFKAVAAKEEIDTHDRKVKAATEIVDQKVRAAALRTVQDEELVALASFDYETKAKNIGPEMDKQKQQLIGASICNFMLGLLKYQLLIDIGNKWVSSENLNQLTAQKLAPIKDETSSISLRMDNMKKIASGIRNLGAAVKLDYFPTSASDSPMPATIN